MTEEAEAPIVKTLAWAIPLSIIITAAWTAFIGWTPGAFLDMVDFQDVPCLGPYFVIGLIFLLALVIPPIRNAVGPKTLVYMYMVSGVSWAFAGWRYPWADYAGTFIQGRLRSLWADHIPWWWAPPKEVIENTIYYGGRAFIDPVWWPSIFGWALLHLSLFFSFLFGFNIIRRIWIDIERVPFVMIEGLTPIFDSYRELRSGGGLGTKAKILLAGIPVGFIVMLPPYLRMVVPWFPDIYGWSVTPHFWGGGWYDLGSAAPALSSIIAGPFGVCDNPAMFAIAMLTPWNIQFSIWMWNLILYYILPTIAAYMGYYPGMLENTSYRVCSRRAWQIANLPPFFLEAFGNVGVLSTLVFMPLILNWRVVLATIRCALGIATPKEREEYEKGEPFSYRVSWIGFIVSTLAAIAWYLAAGTTIIPAILAVFSASLWIWGYTRQYAFCATFNSAGFAHGYTWLKLYWPSGDVLPPRNSPELFVVTRPIDTFQGNCYGQGVGGALFRTGDSYKLAFNEKLSYRNTFIVVAVTAVVAAFTGLITMHGLMATVGWMNMPVGKGGFGAPDPSSWDRRPVSGAWIPAAIAGAITCAVVAFLHFRFVWFPLEPVGLVLGAARQFTYLGYAFNFFVAWVIKGLVLKIGGAKAYEDYVLPFVAGFLIGYGFTIFITQMLGMFYQLGWIVV